MTRSEHVEWCKQRARAYLDAGSGANAVVSMLSDLSKHDECSVPLDIWMLGIAHGSDVEGARKFVEGFN